MSATIRRRGTWLVVPNNMLFNTGTITTIGTALSATANGVMSSSSSRKRTVIRLITTPMKVPRSNPTKAFVPVTSVWSNTSLNRTVKADQIAVGAGNTNGWMSKTRTRSSQIVRKPTPKASGGQTAPKNRRIAVLTGLQSRARRRLIRRHVVLLGLR